MAVFNRKRQGADLSALIHHSDRGVQYLSVRYSDRLADNDHRRVGRVEGRQLRQRPRRELQRALQMGADLQARPMARPRRRRVRHAHLRRLVQPPTPPRPDRTRPRLHHPGRVRDRPLQSTRPRQPGRDSITRASTEPGALQPVRRRSREHGEVRICHESRWHGAVRQHRRSRTSSRGRRRSPGGNAGLHCKRIRQAAIALEHLVPPSRESVAAPGNPRMSTEAEIRRTRSRTARMRSAYCPTTLDDARL